VGDANIRLENGTLDELVRLACVNEFNHLGQVYVLVGFVIRIDIDLTFRVLQATDVGSSRACVLLQEIYEGGQIISEIVRLVQ